MNPAPQAGAHRPQVLKETHAPAYESQVFLFTRPWCQIGTEKLCFFAIFSPEFTLPLQYHKMSTFRRHITLFLLAIS